MKSKIIYLALILFSAQFVPAQELKKEYQKGIIYFIDCVKNDKKEAIANLVRFPLSRETPIPAVKNKADFIKRYDQIFDADLKSKIINSNPAKDWQQVGWRGIMLYNGDLWIDEDGRIIAINYQSKFESDQKAKLIKAEQNSVHPSLTNFKAPVYVLVTSKFKIRIDDLGSENYRYASWSPNQSTSEKPDLVILNGKWFADGSGGNQHFDFKKGNFLYRCYITVLGKKNSAPAALTVYQNGKEILSQDAKISSR
ncbi:hypothetical protein GKZ90_0024830 [Flavobacterium sp. MC2016-06]|jgi:hypothetical protein|uniref:hypothetical protein n=1 Tax=Flavobacterium sp. MC2016-06 TaxID=2676308 RepID=UPI0012BABF2F|nr:hypothetical protein [Flavobacterium sp. MC2016-06]MBU3862374.1 hypothetical protein [Flavobacterium sp. MC2016-06]